MIGRTLSHFRILAKIGEGGMGVVYKALDTKLNRQVAINVLPRDLIADPDRRLRFQREAQAAAALNHPNICTIHEVGQHDGTDFIVMELLEGTTLRERIGHRPAPLKTILPLKAAVKIDSRLVPDQAIATQKQLIVDYLKFKGFGDLEVRQLGGGDEWSQTSVTAPVVQTVLFVYKRYGVEPQVWPRHGGSSPQCKYTRKLGLPAVEGGLGHGGRAHSDDEYLVVEGNDRVTGLVKAEQSFADVLYAYAAWPERTKT